MKRLDKLAEELAMDILTGLHDVKASTVDTLVNASDNPSAWRHALASKTDKILDGHVRLRSNHPLMKNDKVVPHKAVADHVIEEYFHDVIGIRRDIIITYQTVK